jgi:hypothetical protein
MEIERIELHDLDVVGYGPNGLLTRRAWRKVCFEQFSNRHSHHFSKWLEDGVSPSLTSLSDVEYGYTVYLCGVAEPISVSRRMNPKYPQTTIDLIGQRITNRVFLHGDYSAIPIMFDGVDFQSDFVSLKIGLEHEKILTCNFAKFRKQVSFQNSTFKSESSFQSAVFYERVNFENCVFDENADFEKAQFRDDVQFSGSFFKQNSFFRDTFFSKSASFNGANFDLNTQFENATFDSEASFEGALFNRGGRFERAIFRQAPTFLTVSQQSVLLFSGTKFAKDVSQKAIVRFNYLKLLSESAGQAEQALNFNALELYAKRHSSTEKLAFKYGTWFYEKLSDYGRSFARPLALYLGLLAFTWLLAIVHVFHYQDGSSVIFEKLHRSTPILESEKTDKFALSGYRAASEYMVYRAVGVLDFADDGKKTTAVNQRLFEQPFEPAMMRVWGILKAIFSTALLFLVALGLRNRYRLK